MTGTSKPIAHGYRVDSDRAQQTEKCCWSFPGAAGECQNDAVGLAFSDQLGDLPFCEIHMEEGTR